jgi:hypothetical protein
MCSDAHLNRDRRLAITFVRGLDLRAAKALLDLLQ